MLAFPINVIPFRRTRAHRSVSLFLWAIEDVSSAGHDDDVVFWIGTNISKHAHQFFVRSIAPSQRSTIGVKRHLQHTVPALQLHETKRIRVIRESGHVYP